MYNIVQGLFIHSGRVIILSKEYGRIATVLGILFQCSESLKVLKAVAI